MDYSKDFLFVYKQKQPFLDLWQEHDFPKGTTQWFVYQNFTFPG